IAAGEIAEVPEAEGKRAGLYAVRSLAKPLPHQPQPPQAQVTMQAHARIAMHRVVHGADRHTDLPGKLVAVDGSTDPGGEDVLDLLEYLDLPDGVRPGGPGRRNHIGKRSVNAGEHGLLDRMRSLLRLGAIEGRR